MFEFFENTFVKDQKTADLSKIEEFDEKSILSLKQLKEILGSEFRVYKVSAYNKSPKETVNYYTVIFNKKALNFTTKSDIYRRGMERYQEDANVLGREKTLDIEYLDPAPRFSITPYEKDDEIYVPAKEFMENFM